MGDKPPPTRIERPGVQTGYDLWAASYDTTDNPTVHLDRRYSLAALQPQAGEWILDAGCGTAAHTRTLHAQGVHAVGIDFSRGMLAVGRESNDALRLVQGDLHRPLPFPDARFDAVLCSLVSEHLAELRMFFAEVARVLVPQGRLVFTAFHPGLVESGVEANFQHQGTEYRLGAEPHSIADFVAAMRQAGLEDIVEQEVRGDATMVAAIPKAQKYLDRPHLVILQARRPAATA